MLRPPKSQLASAARGLFALLALTASSAYATEFAAYGYPGDPGPVTQRPFGSGNGLTGQEKLYLQSSFSTVRVDDGWLYVMDNADNYFYSLATRQFKMATVGGVTTLTASLDGSFNDKKPATLNLKWTLRGKWTTNRGISTLDIKTAATALEMSLVDAKTNQTLMNLKRTAANPFTYYAGGIYTRP